MKKSYFFYCCTLLFGIVFIVRLAFIQVFSDKYVLHANNVSIKKETIYPQRGYIKDRNGKLLAGNVLEYEIHVTPALLKDDFNPEKFAKLLNIETELITEKLNILKTRADYHPASTFGLFYDIPRENFAFIQETIHNYPAFSVIKRPVRKYFINTAGHILGYIREVDKNYMKRDSLYYQNGDLAGYSGVEKSYEKALRGVKGVRHFKKDRQLNVIGPYKEGVNDKMAINGKDITLTIDYDLQVFAEKLMQNKRGGIVAIEPSSGEILALVSSPIINPNDYNTREGRNRIFYDSINKSQYNRATQAMYPPGSPFKLFTALSAYQMGVIDSTNHHTCNGGFRLGSRRKINCHCGIYGKPIDMETAIARSCNSYFSHTYRKIINKDSIDGNFGINQWKGIMSSFGFGNFLNNDLATGSPGLIPNSAYYDKWRGKKKWNAMSIISNGIGQGEILMTPIQLANGGAVIANNGFFYTPHIVKEIDGKALKDSNFIVPKYSKVDSKHFNIVKQGMGKVVLEGTARGINTSLFTQAGKTGTAQNPHGQDHSIFLNIAPVEKPKIVVSVFIENGHYGAQWAAPISSLIAEKYLKGTVNREKLVEKMRNGDLTEEYEEQWINQVKNKPWYKKLKIKQDSIRKSSLGRIP